MTFIIRFFQAIADNCVWIGGLATINDVIPPEHFGKAMGILSVTIAAGSSAGPVFAGILFEKCGYWVAWSSTFAILFVDFLMRLVMVERPKSQKTGKYFHQYDNKQIP